MTATPLAALLRQLRHDARLTLQDVAVAASLSTSHVSETERGVKVPTVDALEKMLRVYGYRLTVVSLAADEQMPGRFMKITEEQHGNCDS
jgi:transcriptional regulator with XRE-family HTH domain